MKNHETYKYPKDPNDRHIGKILASKYVFEKFLGEGAFGFVYKAYNLQNKQHYAIKMIPVYLLKDERKTINLHR